MVLCSVLHTYCKLLPSINSNTHTHTYTYSRGRANYNGDKCSTIDLRMSLLYRDVINSGILKEKFRKVLYFSYVCMGCVLMCVAPSLNGKLCWESTIFRCFTSKKKLFPKSFIRHQIQKTFLIFVNMKQLFSAPSKKEFLLERVK